jgi:hypothetical protein
MNRHTEQQLIIRALAVSVFQTLVLVVLSLAAGALFAYFY